MLKLFVDNKHTDDHHWVDIVQKDDELIKKWFISAFARDGVFSIHADYQITLPSQNYSLGIYQ